MPNLQKLHCTHKRLLKALSFKKKLGSMLNVLAKRKIPSNFDFFIVEIKQELFVKVHLWNCLYTQTTCKPINTKRDVKGIMYHIAEQ